MLRNYIWGCYYRYYMCILYMLLYILYVIYIITAPNIIPSIYGNGWDGGGKACVQSGLLFLSC